MGYTNNFFMLKTGPGSGRKWVFLHGLMGYASNWKKIISLLPPDECVLAFDQRGHGRSFQPTTGYAPEDYADDLFLILQELEWQKVNLVGHSMGGRNAMNFAWRFPEMVHRLVVEDIAPDINPASASKIKMLLQAIPRPFVTQLQAKEFFLNDFLHLVNSFANSSAKSWPRPGPLGQYFYSNIVETPEKTFDFRFSLPGIFQSLDQGLDQSLDQQSPHPSHLSNPDRWAQWSQIQIPTLVVRGEHSEDLTSEIFLKMLNSNPNAKGVEIANAHHWVHFDQPQQFARALTDFILTEG